MSGATAVGGNTGRLLARRRPRQSVVAALKSWRLQRLLIQILLAAAMIAGWEYLPKVKWLSEHFAVLDPFYVSSPSAVWANLVMLSTTGENGLRIWPYLWTTVEATVVGATVGLCLGAFFGLVFSNSLRVSEVVRPFIVLANSVPRVALIPIFVLLLGPTIKASIVNVIVVVFFLGFFNAFEGGCSIRRPMLENALLLGAGPVEVMRFIRLPLVLTWTFAAVPNAISFGLIVAVTTELLSGIQGMGALLLTATMNVQAGMTFTIIVVLSAVGLVMYGGGTLIRNWVIRWDL